MIKPKRTRGRPKGPAGKSCQPETRVRARAIFDESQHLATDATIAKQLAAEGFDAVSKEQVGVWRRSQDWIGSAPKSREMAELSEETRQAVRVRVPDDLDRVERASIRLAATGERMAEFLEQQLANVKMETPEHVEIVARCTMDLLKTQLYVGKALQDLRLLRVSSAFAPDGSRQGELIPPDRQPNRDDVDPLSAQERIISNFAH